MRKNYLKSIGALSHIGIDYGYKSKDHRERRNEEKYPCKRGERHRHIRDTALLKVMDTEEPS
jgi:hypothetical protein